MAGGEYGWYYENLTVWDCEYYMDPNQTRLNATLIDAKEKGKHDWIIGVGFSILSTLLSCLGLILQKIAQNQQQRLPEDKKFKEWNGIVCSPYWWGSFLVMGLIPFPADFIAFSFAAQSIVVPFAGLTIMLNQLIAPCILDEKLTKKDMVASVFVFGGCIVSTAFGAHDVPKKTICQLLNLFTGTGFYIAIAFLLVFVVLAYRNIHAYESTVEVAKTKSMMVDPDKLKDALADIEKEDAPKREISLVTGDKKGEEKKEGGFSWEKIRPFSFGFIAGAAGGMQNTCFKTAGELMRSGFEKEDGVRSVWKGPYPYFFLIIVVFLAIQQITWLNKGLAQYDAVLALPLYNACYMILSTTLGAIYYNEFENFSAVQAVFFPLGILMTVAGILTLATGHTNTSIDSNAVDSQHKSLESSNSNPRMLSPKVAMMKRGDFDDSDEEGIEMAETTAVGPESVAVALQ